MKLIAWLAAAFVAFLVVMTMAMAVAVSGGSELMTGPSAVDGIPPELLPLYTAAAEKYKIDWAILAAIGKIETDHCRSKAPGVHSGKNSAGAMGCMQFIAGTWALYGKGSPYDPRDAIPAAAHYLAASGAPGDYHRAIFAYNHAEWYVNEVMAQAEEYRAMAVAPSGGSTQSGPPAETWLVQIPGTTETCDARIAANVIMILRRFHATLTACYAPTGHESSGEHPLGLAVDLVPTPPASWQAMAELARYAGWRPACASTGCASQTHTAFRFVGYNGYGGHGDPQHCNCGNNAHLHLSWDHGPGKPASWVRLLAG